MEILKTKQGEEHGLINEYPNSVKDDNFKSMSPAQKEKLEKEKKDDNKLVEARYINKRSANERLTKYYCRWAGDKIQQWKFIPEQVYKVPYGLVKEINSIQPIVRSEVLDANGLPTLKDGTGEREHEFVPVSF